MDVNFFGETRMKSEKYIIFHDESEPKPNRGWLLIGLTFIRERDLSFVKSVLQKAREKESYWGEVHFCKLPKSFSGEFGAKARVARQWLVDYQKSLFQYAHITILAVNRTSPKFDYQRFRENFHAYNRFTAMAIKAGISWLLMPYGYDMIKLTLISDGKNRKSRPDQKLVDNFEEYIPYRVELDSMLNQFTAQRKYPNVTKDTVQTPASHTEDLLQLTDLILGAFQSGLVGSSNRPTKSHLALSVAYWFKDVQKPPWEQSLEMHRKFNVWGFPDENGKAFKNFEMKILKENSNHLSLFY